MNHSAKRRSRPSPDGRAYATWSCRAAGRATTVRDFISHVPVAHEDFVRFVVPELQWRGLFRKAFAGPTLRENLGASDACAGRLAKRGAVAGGFEGEMKAAFSVQSLLEVTTHAIVKVQRCL